MNFQYRDIVILLFNEFTSIYDIFKKFKFIYVDQYHQALVGRLHKFDDLDIFITPESECVVISIFSNTEVLFYKYTEISFLAIPQSPNLRYSASIWYIILK